MSRVYVVGSGTLSTALLAALAQEGNPRDTVKIVDESLLLPNEITVLTGDGLELLPRFSEFDFKEENLPISFHHALERFRHPRNFDELFPLVGITPTPRSNAHTMLPPPLDPVDMARIDAAEKKRERKRKANLK